MSISHSLCDMFIRLCNFLPISYHQAKILPTWEILFAPHRVVPLIADWNINRYWKSTEINYTLNCLSITLQSYPPSTKKKTIQKCSQ